MSEWSFNTSEYTPEERAEAGSYDYGLLPKGTYKARVGLVRWRYWDDGGKTLKIFFNVLDPNYPNNCFVWDCSLVNKRNAQAQSKAHDLFYQLCTIANVDEVQESHEPVQITGKRGSAVLVGEDDWRAIQETLHLVSIPGMRESIVEGMATPVDELEDELDW